MNPVAAHLARALEQHRRWARDNGYQVPAELAALLAIVSGGQGRTSPLPGSDASDDAGVPIAYDYDESGRLLKCSARTIRRLVESGQLRSITVGSAPRIPRSELERFVADQLDQPERNPECTTSDASK